MATPTPLFDIVQAENGLTAVILDQFNYEAAGMSPSDFSSRVATILDYAGEPFAVVTFQGTELTAELEIGNINLWANSTMVWTGSPSYTKTLEFPLSRITKNKYITLLKGGCCQSCLVENALSAADRFLRGADDYAVSGNSAGWQQCCDSAYAYLNQYPS